MDIVLLFVEKEVLILKIKGVMITIEDTNNEKYYINPRQVIYVKRRPNKASPKYKILLSNGEIIMTDNKEGIMSITMSMK